MVPRAGLEPAQRERRGILNPLCLPISPPGQVIGSLKTNLCARSFSAERILTLTRLFYKYKNGLFWLDYKKDYFDWSP